jgi:two-component system, sensor histidine kinase PdtaS
MDPEGRATRVNAAWREFTGRSDGEEAGEGWMDHLHPDDLENWRDLFSAAKRAGRSFTFDYRLRRHDGLYRWLRETCKPESGAYTAVGVDVTDLKEASLRLSEAHHRIKNNMQMVSGLLRLQSRRLQDPATRSSFEDAAGRIQALSIAQDELHRRSDHERVDLSGYLAALAKVMMGLLGRSGIDLRLPSKPQEVAVRQAAPVGMMINELLSNSLKHAFPEGRNGSIAIEVARTGDNLVKVTIADDGVGIPAGTLESPSSLGITLVKSLAGQAGATLTMDGNGGTRVSFAFPSGLEHISPD